MLHLPVAKDILFNGLAPCGPAPLPNTEVSMNLEPTNWLNWLARECQGSCCLHLPELRLLAQAFR